MLNLKWCFLPNSVKAMMQCLNEGRSGFFNFSVIDILDQIILQGKGRGKAVLFTEECLAEALVSGHQCQ